MTGVSPIIRDPYEEECDAITDLCLKSKAHWGYSDDFMDRCRPELTIKPSTFVENFCQVAVVGERLAGVIEIQRSGSVRELEKLFINPDCMGIGLGRRLFNVAKMYCAETGGKVIKIAADPDAVVFYVRMGARAVGETPSGSIASRNLPLLEVQLGT